MYFRGPSFGLYPTEPIRDLQSVLRRGRQYFVMTVDINIYRSRIGIHYSLALRLKGIKYFTNFEFLLFVGMFLFRSGD